MLLCDCRLEFGDGALLLYELGLLFRGLCCVLLGLVKQNRIHRVVSAHSGNFNLIISTTSSGLTLSSLVPTCCLLLVASRERGF
jgi:hypothetical protein